MNGRRLITASCPNRIEAHAPTTSVAAVGWQAPRRSRDWPFTSKEGWPCTRQCGHRCSKRLRAIHGLHAHLPARK